MTTVKGGKWKDGPWELSAPTLAVCALQWTFLHDLGQVTEAKPKTMGSGVALGAQPVPQGRDPSTSQLFPMTKIRNPFPLSQAH